MNGPGGEFLSRAGFSLDEDRGAGGSDLLDRFEDLDHRGGLPDHVFESCALLDLLAELLVFLARIPLTQSTLDEDLQTVDVDRLGHKVIGAPAHGLDCGVD